MSQRIFVLIKPNGIPQKQQIINRIKACGYTIVQSKDVNLTLEQEVDFYASNCQLNVSYPIVAGELADRPVCALCLSYPMPDAGPIEHRNRLQHLVFRQFSENAIHVSENCRRECEFFFGDEVKWNISEKPSIECISTYLNANVHPVLMRALQDVLNDKLNGDDVVLRLAQKLIEMKLAEGTPMPDYSKYERLIARIGEFEEKLKGARVSNVIEESD